jgi:hypothetical protein
MRTVETAAAVGVPFCAKMSPKAATPTINAATNMTTKRI